MFLQNIGDIFYSHEIMQGRESIMYEKLKNARKLGDQ